MTVLRKITLITETETTDAIGQPVINTTTRDLIAEVNSVTSTEYFEGRKNNLSPEFRFRVSRFGYSGEKKLTYNGSNYAIYKTYEADNNYIDLYVEAEAGTTYA